jgi:hypothetical protein
MGLLSYSLEDRNGGTWRPNGVRRLNKKYCEGRLDPAFTCFYLVLSLLMKCSGTSHPVGDLSPCTVLQDCDARSMATTDGSGILTRLSCSICNNLQRRRNVSIPVDVAF